MRLGAQLYTVRAFAQNEKDFARSLQRISQIGYRTVQVSGVAPMPPKTIRRICDDNGLSIVLTHTDPERIRTNIQTVIEEHQTLGCRYVGIGCMPERYRNFWWIRHFAEDYTEPARALKDAGMRLMYHNHNLEWERLPDGHTMLDCLLDTMPAELMGITMDAYWVQAAGADVLDTASRLSNRLQCVHLKDYAVQGFTPRMAPVGGGNINFPRLIAQLKTQGTTEHLLVEQDDCYGRDPFECLRQSYEYVMGLDF